MANSPLSAISEAMSSPAVIQEDTISTMNDPKQLKDRQAYSALQPSWINKALIEQALRNDGEENPQVQAVDVRRALAEGENYGSTIYRVTAALSDGKERSFIIKGPTVAGLSEATQPSGTFQREITMFTDCIPKMEFLVMEDLRPAGFRLADRKRGLGLRHSLLALRGLARFHAASHALLRQRPELERALDNMLNVSDQGHQDFVKGELEATALACRSWPGFQEIAERLDKQFQELFSIKSMHQNPEVSTLYLMVISGRTI
ncbi:Uncharacterized protein GBIM_21079 [Gryllus bimaculatus]|nr:Uncharacterized protein GBIM_21079 [Gryllus bimaculatus]